MNLYQKPDSPYWWFSEYLDGIGRVRKSTKQTGKGLARKVAEAMVSKLVAGDVRATARVKMPTLSEYGVGFLEYINATRLSDKTKRYYFDGCRLLNNAGVGSVRLDAITTEMMEVLEIPGSGSNVNTALKTLRRMLRRAERQGILKRAPHIELVEENQRERLVNAAEEKLILDFAAPTLRDAYILVFDAGMRPGEVARLRWENVDLVRGVILVVRGKTGKKSRRHLPMTSRVRAALIERAKLHDEWVFPSPLARRAGHPIFRHSLTGQFVLLKKKLGLPKEVVLYSARHTFATDLMDATGDLSQTQRTLGHTSVATTTRYLHPAVVKLGAIMDERNKARKGTPQPDEASHDFSHGASVPN